MSNKKSDSLTLLMTGEQKEKGRQQAELRGMSLSNFVRTAVESYLMIMEKGEQKRNKS